MNRCFSRNEKPGTSTLLFSTFLSRPSFLSNRNRFTTTVFFSSSARWHTVDLPPSIARVAECWRLPLILKSFCGRNHIETGWNRQRAFHAVHSAILAMGVLFFMSDTEKKQFSRCELECRRSSLLLSMRWPVHPYIRLDFSHFDLAAFFCFVFGPDSFIRAFVRLRSQQLIPSNLWLSSVIVNALMFHASLASYFSVEASKIPFYAGLGWISAPVERIERCGQGRGQFRCELLFPLISASFLSFLF